MSVYNLVAWVPYEKDDHLFSGTEDDLREFIRKNTTKKEVPNKRSKKGFVIETKVCGRDLYDLEVTIDGPDIRSYIED